MCPAGYPRCVGSHLRTRGLPKPPSESQTDSDKLFWRQVRLIVAKQIIPRSGQWQGQRDSHTQTLSQLLPDNYKSMPHSHKQKNVPDVRVYKGLQGAAYSPRLWLIG
eukprot:1157247-Pelagomonas_calceolata.AAC.11